MAAVTHDELLDHDISNAEPEDAHLRPSEQYMKGGRDTAVLVWSMIALLVAGFMLCAAAAGEPPASAPTTASGS
ncbi:MAG TPA: hypothetical protein VG937_24530 [Polyangiaceae bacterium]|jgi:hypothetical protein|nr:hypothetical protein [Polyangiaceae bacterium]